MTLGLFTITSLEVHWNGDSLDCYTFYHEMCGSVNGGIRIRIRIRVRVRITGNGGEMVSPQKDRMGPLTRTLVTLMCDIMVIHSPPLYFLPFIHIHHIKQGTNETQGIPWIKNSSHLGIISNNCYSFLIWGCWQEKHTEPNKFNVAQPSFLAVTYAKHNVIYRHGLVEI